MSLIIDETPESTYSDGEEMGDYSAGGYQRDGERRVYVSSTSAPVSSVAACAAAHAAAAAAATAGFVPFPSPGQLEEMLMEKRLSSLILPWKSLTTDKWYRIESATTKSTKYGLKTMVKLVDREGCETYAWTPESIAARLSEMTLPIYVRTAGLKTSQKNPQHQYYDVDLL